MNDNEIERIVLNAIEEARRNNKNEDMGTTIDEDIAKDAEYKAVEAALVKRIL